MNRQPGAEDEQDPADRVAGHARGDDRPGGRRADDQQRETHVRHEVDRVPPVEDRVDDGRRDDAADRHDPEHERQPALIAPPPARRPDRRGLALELDRPARDEAVALQQAPRRLGDEHAVARAAGGLLDARGDVDRVADDAEVEAAPAADRADDDEPGVDPDADAAALAEVRLDRRDDRARGGDAAVGVVGQRLGRAEHAEHPVAEELLHAPAVLLEHRHRDPEELVQQRHRLARRDAVGERREVADVDEQHGDHRVLAVHRVLRSHSETWAGWTVSRTTPRRSAPERVEVELVAQPAAERLQRERRVVAAAVEAPVHGGLDPRPRGAEQRRHRQRRDRHREARLAHREADQEHEPEIGGAERGGQRAVDQRAVDDDVDVVEPVAQDRRSPPRPGSSSRRARTSELAASSAGPLHEPRSPRRSGS